MANWFCINKSGKTYNVVDGNDKRIVQLDRTKHSDLIVIMVEISFLII